MPTQAELIRLHREAKGLTLEQVAFNIEVIATSRGIPKKSKAVPRTHASLSRWESGNVQIKETGLEIIASALNMTVEEIRRPPPLPNSPPTRLIEIHEAEAGVVDAFLKAMRAK